MEVFSLILYSGLRYLMEWIRQQPHTEVAIFSHHIGGFIATDVGAIAHHLHSITKLRSLNTEDNMNNTLIKNRGVVATIPICLQI